MEQPLISICIPVYNGETYLKECLDSCLTQTYTNFEILICDDGSGDESLVLIENYQKKHPEVRLYKNEKNLGLVGNWNRCIELANGEWIKFVFQDDYLSPDALAEFVKRITKSTQLIVSKRHFILPENANSELKLYYSKTVRTLENSIGKKMHYSAKELSQAATKNISMNFIAEPSLVLFRKSITTEVGVFNPLLKQICDLEFVLRLGSNFGLEHIPKPLCFFRIHEASTTNFNISSKYFQLRYIEPLLYSWLLLFEPEFRMFRSHLNLIQKTKLKMYFKLKAYGAAIENKKMEHSHDVFLIDSLKFKPIQEAAKGSYFIRMLHRFV